MTEHDPVAVSDAIDERLRMLRGSAVGLGWLSVVLMALVVLGQVATLTALLDISQSHRALVTTHEEVVRVEVGDLRAKIAERDITIAQYKEVVQQATDGLILMGRTITELGGTPPTVVLRPSNPPAPPGEGPS